LRLTKRQEQVARGLLAGKANKEIAYDLGLTENTVKVYCSRMYDQVGANGRMQYANMAREHFEALESLKGVELGEERKPAIQPSFFDKFLAIAQNINLSADELRQVFSVLLAK
jgi:DNA-binding CsgD family transcriptional regulator